MILGTIKTVSGQVCPIVYKDGAISVEHTGRSYSVRWAKNETEAVRIVQKMYGDGWGLKMKVSAK